MTLEEMRLKEDIIQPKHIPGNYNKMTKIMFKININIREDYILGRQRDEPQKGETTPSHGKTSRHNHFKSILENHISQHCQSTCRSRLTHSCFIL